MTELVNRWNQYGNIIFNNTVLHPRLLYMKFYHGLNIFIDIQTSKTQVLP